MAINAALNFFVRNVFHHGSCHIFFSQIKEARSRNNLWLQTMYGNKRLVKWSSRWVLHWLVIPDRANLLAERAIWITAESVICRGISWPSPHRSTSCFSWLSAHFCLYNTNCVWRCSSSYYTAAFRNCGPLLPISRYNLVMLASSAVQQSGCSNQRPPFNHMFIFRKIFLVYFTRFCTGTNVLVFILPSLRFSRKY